MVKFRVTGSQFQGHRLIYPKEYLTPLHVERMAHQPDMILATGRIIRDDLVRSGHDDVDMRADAFVTFNVRPTARLIDPGADLAQVRTGLGPKPWILKSPS